MHKVRNAAIYAATNGHRVVDRCLPAITVPRSRQRLPKVGPHSCWRPPMGTFTLCDILPAIAMPRSWQRMHKDSEFGAQGGRRQGRHRQVCRRQGGRYRRQGCIVVLRYVAEAPLSSMTEAYRRGYASQVARGSGLLGKASSELSSCVVPLPPAQALEHKGPWVENLDSGIVHRPAVWSLEIQPLSWRTACGWAFGHSNTRSVDKLPAKASRRCSCCWKATAATSDAAASNSSSSSSSSSCAL